MKVTIKFRKIGNKRYGYKRDYELNHAINSVWKYKAQYEECYIVFDNMLDFNVLPYTSKDNLYRVVKMIARKYAV